MAQTFNKLVFCSYCSQAGATVLGELRLTIWRAVSDLKSQKKKRGGGKISSSSFDKEEEDKQKVNQRYSALTVCHHNCDVLNIPLVIVESLKY